MERGNSSLLVHNRRVAFRMDLSGISGNQFMPNGNQGFNNNYYNPNQMNQLDRYMEQLNNRNNRQQNDFMNRQQQQSYTNMDFVIVENIDIARNYVVPNGNTMWFRHSIKPEIYVKSVSNIGEPNFQGYTLTPIMFNMDNNNNQNNDMNNTNIQYVPIENFNELGLKVNQLEQKVYDYEQIIRDLSQPKQVVEQPIVENKTTKNVGRPKSNPTSNVGD